MLKALLFLLTRKMKAKEIKSQAKKTLARSLEVYGLALDSDET